MLFVLHCVRMYVCTLYPPFMYASIQYHAVARHARTFVSRVNILE